jgi:hypothetical protein
LRTGEPELDLLSNPARITEQQASASAYTIGLRRRAASELTDANARYRLWMGALAANPDDPEIRRAAFQSAIASRRYQIATALHRGGNDDLAQLADAYLRVGRNHEAEQTAYRLVEARAPGARKLLETARNAARLQQLNEMRMPVFQENYDQDRVVKPKLAALPVRGGGR